MSARTASMCHPGPVVNPTKNPHRAGAANHHLNGSGDNLMVGADPHVIAALASKHPAALIEDIQRRLDRDMPWFLHTNPRDGEVGYSPFSLAVLVTEIVAEHTADLAMERDVLGDLVEALAWDLNAAREGGA